MKIKKLVAKLMVMPFGIAAALTASGSAPYYGNATIHGSAAIDKTYNPRINNSSSSWSPGSKGLSNRKRGSNFHGGRLAQPGRVLSKEEREQRMASATAAKPEASLEDQQAEDMTFRALCRKIASWDPDWLEDVKDSFAENLAPEAAASTRQAVETATPPLGTGTRPHNARHTIVLLISFLIVFGASYTLVNYLLQASRASAQCTASTVVSTVTVSVPVTYTTTYTESIFVSPTACTAISTDVAAAAATDSSSQSTVTSTVTTTSTSTSTQTNTKTKTLTVLSVTPTESSLSTTSLGPYTFEVHSGSTSWANGISPLSGGSLTTAGTTTIYVTKSDSTTAGDVPATSAPAASSISAPALPTATTTSQTTKTHTTTITPSAEVSTLTSVVGPDLTTTIRITKTSTVSSEITATRSSFGGIGSSGWNMTATSSLSDKGTVTTAAVHETLTTATLSVWWVSSDGHTYSTSTHTFTGTLGLTDTSTNTWRNPLDSPGLPGSVLASFRSMRSAKSTASANRTSLPSNVANPTGLTSTSAETSSAFPTMSPGTDGISPASGNPTGSAPQSASDTSSANITAGQSTTEVSTGFPPSLSGNTSTSQAPSLSTDASPASIATTPVESLPSGSSASGVSQSDSIAVTNNTVASATATSSMNAEFSSISIAGAAGQSSSSTTEVSSGNATMPTSSLAVSSDLPISATSTANNISVSPTISIADVSSGSMSVTASSTVTANTTLVSATPSTQLLSSIGSSLANGPATTVSPSVSSIISSAQTSSSSGISLSDSLKSASSSTTSAASAESSSSSSTLSTSTTSTQSKTSASASMSPTACGEHGDFVLDFDDLPSFSGNEDITQSPPIFSPYHHLTFSNGYVHAPQSKQPFAPHSGDQLAVFLASGNGTNDTTWHQNGMSANAPRMEPGEISDGPWDGEPAFWFNAQGAWLGCDSDGPEPCVFNVTGQTWDAQLGDEVPTHNTQISIPACSNFDNCQLQHVDFPDDFTGLSGIQIQASDNGKPVMFFMDDLALSWYDNSCAAGMKRMARPGTSGGPGRSGGGRKRVVRRTLMR